jgi:hypothetical protein
LVEEKEVAAVGESELEMEIYKGGAGVIGGKRGELNGDG